MIGSNVSGLSPLPLGPAVSAFGRVWGDTPTLPVAAMSLASQTPNWQASRRELFLEMQDQLNELCKIE